MRRRQPCGQAEQEHRRVEQRRRRGREAMQAAAEKAQHLGRKCNVIVNRPEVLRLEPAEHEALIDSFIDGLGDSHD